MSKKIANRQPTISERVCDDCSIGEWYDVHWNRSHIDKKPLTKHCPYRGKGILRGTPACEQWRI